MGLAASQARMLFLTARKSDVEFSEMKIANEKISLSRNSEEISEDYQRALNARKLTWITGGTETSNDTVDLSYDLLMSPNSKNQQGQYMITNTAGAVVLSDKYMEAMGLSGSGGSSDPTVSREVFLRAMGVVDEDEAVPASKYNMNGTYKTSSTSGTTTTTGDDETLAVTGEHYKEAFDLLAEMGTSGISTSNKDLIISQTEDLINVFEPISEDLEQAIEEANSQTEKTKLITLKSTIDAYIKNLNFLNNIAEQNAPSGLLHDIAAMINSPNGGLSGDTTAYDTRGTKAYLLGSGYSEDEFTYWYDDSNGGNETDSVKFTNNGWSAAAIKSLGEYAGGTYGGYKYTETPITHNIYSGGMGTITNTTNVFDWHASLTGQYTNIEDGDNGNGDGEITATAKSVFYDNLYYAVMNKGWVSASGIDDDSSGLENGLRNGNYFLEKYKGSGKWSDESISDSDSPISDEKDTDAVTAAKAKYETEKTKLETKESELDLDLKNLDTERAALDTEIDSVKSILKSNIERSFKMFQG